MRPNTNDSLNQEFVWNLLTSIDIATQRKFYIHLRLNTEIFDISLVGHAIGGSYDNSQIMWTTVLLVITVQKVSCKAR